MALVTKTYTFTAGASIIASEHNSNFDTIYNDYNGNITNANLASGASIADTKLGQITTNDKVHASAFVATSEATGDLLYFNGTAWVRLAIGSAGQFLKVAGGIPTWSA